MSCDKCDGSGLIPLVKSGKVIPNTFTHCLCHPIYGDNPESEHYRPISLEDYDFPCSSSFRAFTYQYCGVLDPGYIPSEPEPSETPPQEIIHRHSDMSKQDFALLRNLEGQVKYLQGKLTEREKKKQDYY